jgi:hypothetical protein
LIMQQVLKLDTETHSNWINNRWNEDIGSSCYFVLEIEVAKEDQLPHQP